MKRYRVIVNPSCSKAPARRAKGGRSSVMRKLLMATAILAAMTATGARADMVGAVAGAGTGLIVAGPPRAGGGGGVGAGGGQSRCGAPRSARVTAGPTPTFPATVTGTGTELMLVPGRGPQPAGL